MHTWCKGSFFRLYYVQKLVNMIIIQILVGVLVHKSLFAGSTSKTNRSITELILSEIDHLCPYSICQQFDEGSKHSSQTEWTSEYVPCCGGMLYGYFLI